MKILAGVAILCLVVVLYWPITHAGFVWTDRVGFDDPAWFAYTDNWGKLLTHNFFGWINYFRPLGIVLFALEIKIFGFSAPSMHVVSLTLHLLNTSLVGLLGLHVLRHSPSSGKSGLLCGLCAVVYALHPALIEPAAWISCQFDLAVTFFMLLGLWLNEIVSRTPVRIISVAVCFFLASCSKESAASFPLVLFLFDFVSRNEVGLSNKLRSIWRSQRYVYVAILFVGIVYLILRHSWLGALLQSPRNESSFSVQRFQEVCTTYLTYWRIILWPMYELGPLHEFDSARFGIVDVTSVTLDLTALLILAGGAFLSLKRSYVGFIVVAVTLSLLPMLHLVPVAFDESLYHERYAMFAIALAMTFLPAAIYEHLINPVARSTYFFGLGITLLWSAAAVANIRVTVPLWSNELTLWRWMQREHPESLIVKDHLLSTYIELGEYKKAAPLADQLVADDAQCPNCLLNAANLALAQNDIPRASAALERLKDSKLIVSQPRTIQGYIVANGRFLELQGRTTEAEEAYRGAVARDSLDAEARIDLALLLARDHRPTEARSEADKALNLYPEEERTSKQRMLERELDAISSSRVE